MDFNARRDLVLLGAGLLGVAVGSALRPSPPESEREGASTARHQLQTVTLPTLVATSTLARKMGDTLKVDDDKVLVHAALAFATGAALTYFADNVGGLIPGLRPGSRK